MKTLLIDNEPAILRGLRHMLGQLCPELEILGEAHGVQSGLELIRNHPPDLVFLDVELDDGKAMDLLAQVQHRDFQVIFITAYGHYALDAFKFSAIDFLLKPIDPDELLHAVDKARDYWEKNHLQLRLSVLMENVASLSKEMKKIILRDQDNIHIVPIPDILYCQADGSYTRFFLADQNEIMVSKNLKEYEKLLKNYGFFRSHHSYLVNLHHVVRFDKQDGGTLILKNQEGLPVSFRKRDQLFEILTQL